EAHTPRGQAAPRSRGYQLQQERIHATDEQPRPRRGDGQGSRLPQEQNRARIDGSDVLRVPEPAQVVSSTATTSSASISSAHGRIHATTPPPAGASTGNSVFMHSRMSS